MTAVRLVRELIDEMGAGIEYGEIDVSVDAAAMREYGVQVVPSVAVLDGSGTLVEFFGGVPRREPLKRAMEKAAGGR